MSSYSQALGGKAKPSREHVDRIATKRAEIYRCRPPEGLRVPILVTPVAVEDRILEEAEVAQAVQGLKRVRSYGPSVMREEDLKGWLWEASR